MKNLTKLCTTSGILSALIVATPALTQNQQPSPRVPRTPPDLTLSVQKQKGTCPKTVGLWNLTRQYEGGAEFTVIADTTAIAEPVKLISSSQKFAEYRAPLKKNFASCVGRTTLKEASMDQYPEYIFRFQNKNVIFRVQLPPDTPSKPSGIVYKNVVSSRPAVRWQLAD